MSHERQHFHALPVGDDSHERWLSKRNLTAAVHWLTDQVHQEPIAALSNHFIPPGELTHVHIKGDNVTVNDEPYLPAYAEIADGLAVKGLERMSRPDQVHVIIQVEPPIINAADLASGRVIAILQPELGFGYTEKGIIFPELG